MGEVWFLGFGGLTLPFTPFSPRLRSRSTSSSSSLHPPSLRSRPPYIQLRGLGSVVSSPSVVRVSAPPENEFGAPLLSREKATGGTQNTANMTAYRDGVGPSPWGGSQLGPL